MHPTSRQTPNRLGRSKSPYLLQHAHNPVDWYPWEEAAFEKARRENKPVFLSIGYAACHWCHVMAHESFEDQEVADLLNQHFVAVKVDSEERPDVDGIYMTACMALAGHGGWPLSIFMTPDRKPFYAGTYFPRLSRMNMPGFLDLLTRISQLWREDSERLAAVGEEALKLLQPEAGIPPEGEGPTRDTLAKGYQRLENAFDPDHGGFGSPPKFPTPHRLAFLLRWHHRQQEPRALAMVEKTLSVMRRGGIFDQIGYGFHRYSVDGRWLVPHFEKMLYDQALLTTALIETHQATGKSEYAQAAGEVLTYVLRDMTGPDGGFYTAEDADSEGHEGLFYLWTPGQVRDVLGRDTGELICRLFDVTDEGNFEDGRSILHLPVSLEAFAAREGMDAAALARTVEAASQSLFAARDKRIHPLKDDKVLTAWNGLMIAAFAKAFQVLGKKVYLDAAEAGAAFVLDRLRQPDGRLLRRYRDGEAAVPGFLDDYAFLAWGMIELYEAGFDPAHLETALRLSRDMIDLFWDSDAAGFFFTGKGNEPLIARRKEVYDGALPSGNSVAVHNLLRLGRMTGETALEEKAAAALRFFAGQAAREPSAYSHLLMALDFMLGPAREVVVAAGTDPGPEEMLAPIRKRFRPRQVVMVKHQGKAGERLSRMAPFTRYMEPRGGRSAAYVCREFACQAPVADPRELEPLLD